MQKWFHLKNNINPISQKTMKKNLLLSVSLIGTLLVSSAFIIRYSTGIAGRTGSPGESNCTACHNTGTAVGTTSISSTPSFSANQYVPGQTYTVSITCTHATLSHFGFGCEILDGTSSAATNAGVMTGISGSSKLLTSGTRKNATHISTATGTGSPFSKTFNFQWVAPASGTAAIYVAGLAVNNNGNDGSGDAMKTASLVLTAASTGTTSTGVHAIDAISGSLNVFPNPSSNELNVQYSLLNESVVSASLYDLQGKEIATLFKSKEGFGVHTEQVAYPANIAPGVYMLKLSINGALTGQKMLIKN